MALVKRKVLYLIIFGGKSIFFYGKLRIKLRGILILSRMITGIFSSRMKTKEIRI